MSISVILIGILKGSFVEDTAIPEGEGEQFMYRQNLGISAVVPGYRLMEVLFCAEAVAQRES